MPKSSAKRNPWNNRTIEKRHQQQQIRETNISRIFKERERQLVKRSRIINANHHKLVVSQKQKVVESSRNQLMSAVYNSGGGGPSCDANGMVEFHTLGQPGQYGSASGPGGFLSAAPHQLISHHSHHPQQMVSPCFSLLLLSHFLS